VLKKLIDNILRKEINNFFIIIPPFINLKVVIDND